MRRGYWIDYRKHSVRRITDRFPGRDYLALNVTAYRHPESGYWSPLITYACVPPPRRAPEPSVPSRPEAPLAAGSRRRKAVPASLLAQ